MNKLYRLLIFALVLSLAGLPVVQAEAPAKYDKTLDMKIGIFYGSKWSKDNLDVMQQYIQDKFNVRFDALEVTWGDFEEKMGVAAASGELPDMFCDGIRGTQTYYDWIDQGIIQPWVVDKERHPKTYATVHAPHIEGLWKDGKTYFLPKFSYMIPSWWCMDKAIFVRKDWMEKLGIEDPKNDAEFLEMCKAFREKDPDGNGVKDTYGIAPAQLDSLFYFEYGAYPDGTFGSRVWDKDTGRYTLNALTKRGFEGLKFFRHLFQADVFDPDFPTYKGKDAMNAFVTGRCGVLLHSGPPDHIRGLFDLWVGVNKDKNFFDSVKILYPWPDKDGRMCYNMNVEFGETYLNADTSKEEMERYLDIHEWFLSDEGILFSALGLKGISYDVNPDGTYKSLLGKRETGDPIPTFEAYPSLHPFKSFACYSGAHAQFFNPKNPREMVKMSEDYRDYMIAHAKPDDIDYDIRLINSPLMNMLGIDMEAEEMEFIMQPKEMSDEEAYELFKQKLESYGLGAALDELNQMAAEAGLPKAKYSKRHK